MKKEDISDEVLISYYRAAENELDALKKIVDGFNDIGKLPLNRVKAYRQYRRDWTYYIDAVDRCERFLDLMKNIMDERGLL